MTIETRYNIGDKVWFMYNNSVKCEPIIKINALIEKDMNSTNIHITILYHLYDYCTSYIESKLFPTKEELLKSL